MSRATLTTLTPVHVGNGRKYQRNFDFIVEHNRIGFIDLHKVFGIIGDSQQTINLITDVIERKQNLMDTLKSKCGKSNIKLEDISNKIININGQLPQNVIELKEHYSTSLKGICIPGSSLKGAIKTAILKHLTSEPIANSSKKREYVNTINWRDKKKINFNTLDKLLFGNTANAKSTRFIAIGDIQFNTIQSEAITVSYMNLCKNNWVLETSKSQLIECIPEGKQSSFTFSLNKELIDLYKRKESSRSVDSELKNSTFLTSKSTILKIINESTRRIIEWDIMRLNEDSMDVLFLNQLKRILDEIKNCNENQAILRVGGHIGWSYMTNRWIIYDEELSDDQYDMIQSVSQRTDKYIGLLFPKTRKMTLEKVPLGFVRISLQ